MGLTRIRAEQISDIDYKQAVRVAITNNVVLNGGAPSVVDNVNIVVGDRVLVNGNTNKAENGLYIVQILGSGSDGTWIRSNDANNTGEIQAGMIVMVTEGSAYADTQWKLVTNDPIVVGTTELEFVATLGNTGGYGIETLSYTGDGSTLAYPVTSGQTTNTILVSLNGVVQSPANDYNVVGTNVVFDQAPESGVSIIIREFTSPGDFLTGNVILGTDSNNTLIVNSQLMSNLIPNTDSIYNLGSDSLKWKDLYLSGNSIILGNLVIKNTGGNTIGFFGPDGTTPGTIDTDNIDSAAIRNGNSNVSVIASGGNVDVNIAGSPIVTFWSGGINNQQANGVGNIGSNTSRFNTVFAKATSAQYADLAEMYEADSEYPVGTVLIIGGDKEVTQSTKFNDSSVIGTVSDKPAYIMNSGINALHPVAVALTGRVPVRVVGTICKGDLLVTSNTPGTATKLNAENWKPGAIFAKALESYNSHRVGVIEAVVGRF